jgi:hypothetical protein
MKYRIQENYKQTDEIPNTGTIQTNRWNTEHRSTTNKQMKYRIQEHYKLFVVLLYSVFHLFVCIVPVFGISNKWNTEYRNTTNKQMKYRIQEHYKQTDEIPNTGTLQTNRLLCSVFHLFCLYYSYIRYFICFFVVFLYSVFHLFVCSARALQTNRWNTEYRNTTNKQMKYRTQEHYKQTDEIPNATVCL